MWPLLRLWIGSKEALRVVCVIVVAGWVLAVAFFVTAVVASAPAAQAFMRFAFSGPGLVALVFTGGAVGIAHFALLFPRCARCSRLLFDDGRLGSGWDVITDIRHHRAKTFMNSYRTGAIVELAITGNMNCSRCGHKLGTKPDYVVTAPE